jgi:Flp pilus assembly protein TadG
MRPRRRDDAGSLALEMAMLAPCILLIFGLIFAYGRVAQVHGVLDAGTRDAARTATRANTYGDARAQARQVVAESITGAPAACQDNLHVTLTHNFEPGQTITVSATCHYGLSDVLPGAPGSVTATSTFSSMLDPNHGID